MARNVNVDITAQDRTKKAFRSANSSMQKLTGSIKGLAVTYLGLHAAISGVSKLIRVTADYQNFANRLKLVSDNSKELAKNQKDLFDIAQRTRVAYGGSVELFTRMSLATQHLGFDSTRLKGVLETVNQTVAISGSSAQAATAGLIQFSQGLASNRLGGEELRSVMEQIPPLGYAIAEGMGVTIGEFRKLSKEGKLTAEVVIKAIEKMKGKVQDDFDKTAVTIDHAYTRLANTLGRLFGEDSTLGDSITKLLNNVNEKMVEFQTYLDKVDTEKFYEGLERAYEAAKSFVYVLALAKGASLVWAIGAAARAAWLALPAFAALSAMPAILALAGVVAGITYVMVDFEQQAEKTANTVLGLKGRIEDINLRLKEGGEVDWLWGWLEDSPAQVAGLKIELRKLNKQLKETKGILASDDNAGPNDPGLLKDLIDAKKKLRGVLDPIETSEAGYTPPKQQFALTEEQKLLEQELVRLKEEAAQLQDDNYMMGVFGGKTEQEIVERTVKIYERLNEIEEEQKEIEKKRKDERNNAATEEHNRKKKRWADEEAAKDRIAENNRKREEALQKAKVKALQTYLKASITVAGALAGQSKTAFRIHKGVATAEAIINTHQSITAALSDSEVHPWVRIANAALFAAQGFASVHAIQSQNYNGGGGGGGSGGGGLPASAGGAAAGPTPGSAVTSTIAGGSSGLDGEPRDAVNITIEGEGEMSFERVAQLIKQIDGARHDGMTSNIRLVGA